MKHKQHELPLIHKLIESANSHGDYLSFLKNLKNNNIQALINNEFSLSASHIKENLSDKQFLKLLSLTAYTPKEIKKLRLSTLESITLSFTLAHSITGSVLGTVNGITNFLLIPKFTIAQILLGTAGLIFLPGLLFSIVSNYYQLKRDNKRFFEDMILIQLEREALEYLFQKLMDSFTEHTKKLNAKMKAYIDEKDMEKLVSSFPNGELYSTAEGISTLIKALNSSTNFIKDNKTIKFQEQLSALELSPCQYRINNYYKDFYRPALAKKLTFRRWISRDKRGTAIRLLRSMGLLGSNLFIPGLLISFSLLTSLTPVGLGIIVGFAVLLGISMIGMNLYNEYKAMARNELLYRQTKTNQHEKSFIVNKMNDLQNILKVEHVLSKIFHQQKTNALTSLFVERTSVSKERTENKQVTETFFSQRVKTLGRNYSFPALRTPHIFDVSLEETELTVKHCA